MALLYAGSSVLRYRWGTGFFCPHQREGCPSSPQQDKARLSRAAPFYSSWESEAPPPCFAPLLPSQPAASRSQPLPGSERGLPGRSAPGSPISGGCRGQKPAVGRPAAGHDTPQCLPRGESRQAGLGGEKQDEEALEGNVPGKLFYLTRFITVLPFIVYMGKKIKSFPLLHSPPGPDLSHCGASSWAVLAGRRHCGGRTSAAPRAEPRLQLWGTAGSFLACPDTASSFQWPWVPGTCPQPTRGWGRGKIRHVRKAGVGTAHWQRSEASGRRGARGQDRGRENQYERWQEKRKDLVWRRPCSYHEELEQGENVVGDGASSQHYLLLHDQLLTSVVGTTEACFPFRRCQFSQATLFYFLNGKKINGIHFGSPSQEECVLPFRALCVFHLFVSVYGLKCNYRQAWDPEVYIHATLVPIVTLTIAARLPCYWTISLQGESGHKKIIPKFTSSFKLNKLIGVHSPHLTSPAEVNLILCNYIQHSKTILTFSLSLHNPLGHVITRS